MFTSTCHWRLQHQTHVCHSTPIFWLVKIVCFQKLSLEKQITSIYSLKMTHSCLSWDPPILTQISNKSQKPVLGPTHPNTNFQQFSVNQSWDPPILTLWIMKHVHPNPPNTKCVQWNLFFAPCACLKPSRSKRSRIKSRKTERAQGYMGYPSGSKRSL